MQQTLPKWSWNILAFVVTYALMWPWFSDYILDPNHAGFVNTGDFIITFYDMIFHTRYDDGFTFSGMNHPVGEYIFMTDANGSFATVFRWINQYISIDHIIPGIYFTLVFFCIGLGGSFMFMILKSWGVRPVTALILGPVLLLFSPQISRLPAHLSLSFPFIIPMTILWATRKFNVPKVEWRDFFFFLVLFFFFMNNAYVGFIATMLLGAIGGFLFLLNYKNKSIRFSGLYMMLTAISLVVVVYAILKINDPYTDRLKEQWGFFHYHTKWYSLLFPKYSWVSSFIAKYQVSDSRSIEWGNNLGVVPILTLLFYALYAAVKKWGKKDHPILLPKNALLMATFWAVFVMYLFAANTSYFPIKDFIEDKMGALLMFKSSGRFAWPLYFFVGIITAIILDRGLIKLKEKSNVAFGAILILSSFFWFMDFTHFYNVRFEGKDKKLLLTGEEMKMLEEELPDTINNQKYQAMFVLPLYQGWNEKILPPVHKRSEESALMISAYTGIPMINSRLSRNSTQLTLRNTQFVSHPLIQRSLLSLPDERPILIVLGKGAKHLNPGTKYIKQLGEPIFETSKYRLFELTLDRLYQIESIEKAVDKYQTWKSKDTLRQPLIYLGYDDQSSENSVYGPGSGWINKGKTVLIDTTVALSERTKFKFFAWNEITDEKYGMPVYHFEQFREDGSYKKEQKVSRIHTDIYKNWIRSEHQFFVPPGNQRIVIYTTNNQQNRIDEVALFLAKDTIVNDRWLSEGIVFDGFPIDASFLKQ